MDVTGQTDGDGAADRPAVAGGAGAAGAGSARAAGGGGSPEGAIGTPPSLSGLSTYLLSRIGKTARGRLGDRLAARGLRLWHMAVLAALADFGPHVQRDLGARLALHPSDVAKVVEDLSAAGHVERTRDPADRRRVRVAVTAAGRAELAGLDAEARAVQDEILDPLTGAERDQLAGLLRRVFEGLHRDGAIPV